MTKPEFLIVSDFDDTIKITHTTNRFRTVVRGLFAKQAYAGMAELYQEWSAGRPFVVLSSSPNVIRRKIGRFLDRHEYPKREIWLRDWFKQKDLLLFKQENLKKLDSRAESLFIFVGDDADYDPEVFTTFRDAHPGQVLAIYIRRVRGRPLPDGVIPFYSAFEIALAELSAARLKIPQVSRIGKAILEHRDTDYVVPYFASAPLEIPISGNFPTLEKVTDLLNERYAKIRSGRESK